MLLRRTEKIVLREDEEVSASAGAPVRRGLSALRPQKSAAADIGIDMPADAVLEPAPAAVAEAPPSPPRVEVEGYRRIDDPPPPNLSPEQRRNIERWRAEVLQSVASNGDDNDGGRLGRFLKPANVALLAVAILAGGAAAFLAMQQPPAAGPAVTASIAPPAPDAIVVQEPMAKVLVAKADINIGERLSDESVEWIDWPQDALRAEFMTAEAADAATGVDNAVARYEFVAGEPIREAKLTRAAEGFLSAVLDPGTRAVAVAVSAESASGGFVLPNDRVDVVHTISVNDRQVSATILSNIRVLAINSSLGKTDPEATEDGEEKPKSRTFATALATLSLSPKQAEVIISATQSGRLSLVLRPTADVAEAAADARSQAANEAIRISSPFWAR
jgi:pilus assembly protein CpaB